MRRGKKDKGDCAVPECEEKAATAGFCGACYSSWYRLRDMTMPEIARYLWRVKRLANRVPILSRRRPSR